VRPGLKIACETAVIPEGRCSATGISESLLDQPCFVAMHFTLFSSPGGHCL